MIHIAPVLPHPQISALTLLPRLHPHYSISNHWLVVDLVQQRCLSYKIATDLQRKLSAAYNRTPSIHPESSTSNGFSVQCQLCEISTEVKKTNDRISQYDGRLKAMEQKLINLEQSTSCSLDEFSHPLKRKVPEHVRVRRYLRKNVMHFYIYC